MAGLILDVRAHAPPRATRRHGRHRMSDAGLSALRVEYRADSTAILLDRPDTLAVLGFGAAETGGTDPRHLCVPLRPLSRRSDEHTSELQSPLNIVCRIMIEKKKSRT